MGGAVGSSGPPVPCIHDVVHYRVPALARRHAEKSKQRRAKVFEVGVLVVLAVDVRRLHIGWDV